MFLMLGRYWSYLFDTKFPSSFQVPTSLWKREQRGSGKEKETGQREVAAAHLRQRTWDQHQWRLPFGQRSRFFLMLSNSHLKLGQANELNRLTQFVRLKLDDWFSLLGLGFPRRPSWNYDMTRESLLRKEERSYKDFLDNLHSKNPPGSLSHFEHNLEASFKIAVWPSECKCFTKTYFLYYLYVSKFLPLFIMKEKTQKKNKQKNSLFESCSK